MGQQIKERPVVLVVEDEFLIRMDAVDMVRAAGFDAVEASDADEAISSQVATDIEMPGSMDGLRLAAAVRDR